MKSREYTKFRKKPVVVSAARWWRNGDHPEDLSEEYDINGLIFLTEGKIVRKYRNPYGTDLVICKHCNLRLTDHGWINTFEGGHIVCPGDWIVKGIAGEFYPVKNTVFVETYDEVG